MSKNYTFISPHTNTLILFSLISILLSCANQSDFTDNNHKNDGKSQQEINRTVDSIENQKVFLFYKFYYDMYEKDAWFLFKPENSIVSDRVFNLPMENNNLEFYVYPIFKDNRLKLIYLELNSENECNINTNSMSLYEVVIYEGMKEWGYSSKGDKSKVLLDKKTILTKNISRYSLENTKKLMGSKYGVVPEYYENSYAYLADYDTTKSVVPTYRLDFLVMVGILQTIS
ncbi:MAG: hypothetical protein R2759_11115 [Bacteroidales bacterium]